MAKKIESTFLFFRRRKVNVLRGVMLEGDFWKSPRGNKGVIENKITKGGEKTL